MRFTTPPTGENKAFQAEIVPRHDDSRRFLGMAFEEALKDMKDRPFVNPAAIELGVPLSSEHRKIALLGIWKLAKRENADVPRPSPDTTISQAVNLYTLATKYTDSLTEEVS